MFTREDATERLLEAKRDRDVSYETIAGAVDRDEVWTAALVMGETSASAEEAEHLVEFLEPEDPERVAAAVQRPPTKGDEDPTVPSDPMLYRLYEVPHVYGDAIKAVVHEEFGDIVRLRLTAHRTASGERHHVRHRLRVPRRPRRTRGRRPRPDHLRGEVPPVQEVVTRRRGHSSPAVASIT